MRICYYSKYGSASVCNMERDTQEEDTHPREKSQISEEIAEKIGNELTGGELFTDELSTAQKGSEQIFFLGQRSWRSNSENRRDLDQRS